MFTIICCDIELPYRFGTSSSNTSAGDHMVSSMPVPLWNSAWSGKKDTGYGQTLNAQSLGKGK